MSSSSDDWSPSATESLVPRRSSRLSKKQPTKSEIKSSPPAKIKKPSPTVKKQTPLNSIDSLLTQEELKILFDKWARDHHFRAVSPVTQAPLVVSTVSDGKSVTTNISCYKQEKYFMRELASTIAPLSGISEKSSPNFDEKNIASSVTFTTPLIPLDPNSVNGRNASTNNESKNTNSTETAPKTPTLVHNTSGILNPPENPKNYNPQLNNFIPTFNDQLNIPQIPSSGFTTPTRSNQSQTVRSNLQYIRPNLNPRNLSSTSATENRSHTIGSGMYLPSSNGANDLYGIFDRPDLQIMNNRYNNGINSNSQNFFPTQNGNNGANAFNNWNSMYQMGLNNFASSQSMNSNSDFSYASSANSNGIIRDNSHSSGYSSSSVPSWNGEQYWRNNYWNGGNSYNNYNNIYGNQNSAGVQQLNRENWPLNSNIGNDTSGVFDNIPGLDYFNFPEIKNIENDLRLLDDEKPGFDKDSSTSSYEDAVYDNFNENSKTNENAISTTLNDGIIPSSLMKREIIDFPIDENDRFQYNNDSLPGTIRQSSVPECILIE